MLLRPTKTPRPTLPLEALEDRLLLHGDSHHAVDAGGSVEDLTQSSPNNENTPEGDPPQNLTEGSALGATISGTVYGDLTGDGLTGDDPRLANVTVELFSDGGDGIFGNDTFLGADQTDSTGRYDFSGLNAGTYFLRQAAVAGYFDNPTVRLAKVIIPNTTIPGSQVDSFNTTEQLAFANGVLGTRDSSSVAASEAIGGERDFSSEVTSSAGLLLLTSSGGKLNFGTGADATGTYIVTWDGADGDPDALDPTGLGGLDLTGAGASNGFRFKAGADHNGATFELRIYTDATHWSKAVVTLPNTGGLATGDVTVLFSDFITGGEAPADFTHVGAVQIQINATDGLDVQLDQFEAFGPTNQTHDFPNETLPTMMINDITVTEGDEGTVDAVFTMTLSKPSPMTIVMTYGTTEGPAVPTLDYLAAAGLWTFIPGSTTATVTIAVTGDTIVEPTETFSLSLSALNGATFARSVGVATILDNDVELPPPVATPFVLFFNPPPSIPGLGPGVPPGTTPAISNSALADNSLLRSPFSGDAYGSGGDSDEEEAGPINLEVRMRDALDEVLAGFGDFRPRRSAVGEEVTGLLMNLADADQPHLLATDSGDEVLHQPTVRKLQKREGTAVPPEEYGMVDEVLGLSRYWWLIGLPIGGLVGRAAWLYRDRAGQIIRNVRRRPLPK